MRRFPNEPLVLRQLHVADLAGVPVLFLPCRPKYLAPYESFAGIELADHVVGPRLPITDLLFVEKPRHLDRAFALAGDHLCSAHDPRGGIGIDFGTFLDRTLVGDDKVAIGVLHVHESVPDTGRLDVVAAAEGIVHAPLHFGPQLRDERLVHRAENG